MHLGDILNQEDDLRARAMRFSSDPLTPFPILSAKIKLTWHCNLRCEMCELWQRCRVQESTLPLDRVLQALTNLKEHGLRKVHFSGGEVLLYPKFREVVKHARALDLQVNLTTNGTLIDKDWARFFVNQRVHTVTISIDSARRKEHDRIRGVEGAWDASLKAIDLLQDRKARKGRGPKIAVNTLVSSRSADDLQALFELLTAKGIDSWRLLPLDTPDKKQRASAEQWQRLAEQWQHWQPLLARIPVDWSSERSAERAAKGKFAGTFYPEHRCHAPWFNLFIDADGKVYPCCMGKIEMMPYGNLLGQRVGEFLASAARRDTLCSFASGHLYPICERCDDFLEENTAFHNIVGG